MAAYCKNSKMQCKSRDFQMLAVNFISQLMLVIKSILAVETSLFYDAK